jgi:hypothetical protein
MRLFSISQERRQKSSALPVMAQEWKIPCPMSILPRTVACFATEEENSCN